MQTKATLVNRPSSNIDYKHGSGCAVIHTIKNWLIAGPASDKIAHARTNRCLHKESNGLNNVHPLATYI